MSFSYKIKQGRSGQDLTVVHENKACLVDGHGDSQIAKDLVKFVCEQFSGMDIEEFKENIFKNVRTKFKNEIDQKSHFGTTLTCVIEDEESFVFFFIGDSPGFIFGSDWMMKCTENHDIENEKEVKRILDMGGNLGMFKYHTNDVSMSDYLPFYDENGKIDYSLEFEASEKLEKARIDYNSEDEPEKKQEYLMTWKKLNKEYKQTPKYNQHLKLNKATVTPGQYGTYFVTYDTCIATTSSIGDFYCEYIGTEFTKKSINKKELASGKKCIFVCSDGVSDCFLEEELQKIVMSTENDDDLLQIFVDKADQVFGSGADDISFFRKFFE